MIESTFILLNGIGEATERKLWRQGIGTWKSFLDCRSVSGISSARKALYDEEVSTALEHWQAGEARYFARCLKPRDHWRLYDWLRPRAVYLDIETGGPYSDVTVVGLYAEGRMTSLVRGESLSAERLGEELSRYNLIITFFGSAFDIPVLKAKFPRLTLDQPHIDLCFLARRLGMSGGLKQIEWRIGIERPRELQGLDGWDAVRLWNCWRYSHDESSLQQLLAYNQADAANLEPLADLLYAQLAQQYQAAP